MTTLTCRIPAWQTRRTGRDKADIQQCDTMPTYVVCSYTSADPYTVRMHTLPEVAWVCSRELIAAALWDPRRDGALGNVRLTVLPGDVMRIEIDKPTVRVWVPAAEVREFLEDTQQLVPLGKEHHHINWDTELAGLLTGPGGVEWS
jgi:hypothetical protein